MKRQHSLYECKRLRAAWHEAGHAVIALMNHPWCIDDIRIMRNQRERQRTGFGGYVKLRLVTEPGSSFYCQNYAEAMPPEYSLAGAVAEYILLGEPPDTDEWLWECGATADIEELEEQFPGQCSSDDLIEIMKRTHDLLVTNKTVLRAIARKLLREGSIRGWNKWLHEVAGMLPVMAPFPYENNNALKGRFEMRRQL